MKLSEILKPVNKDNLHGKYLVFNEFDGFKPFVMEPLYPKDDKRMYFKCENANIDYICYYLKLNMESYVEKLFTPTFETTFDNELSYKIASVTGQFKIESFDYIEIGNLPPIEFQNNIIIHLKNLYFPMIGTYECKCDELNYCTVDEMEDMEIIKVVDLYDVCKIDDIQLFLKYMFEDNLHIAAKYMTILDPNVVFADYLVFYIYYNDELSKRENYTKNGFNVKDIKLPNLADQCDFLAKYFTGITCRNIQEYRRLISENKIILRDMINSFK